MGSNIKFHNMGSLYIGGRVKNNPLQPTSNGDIPYYNGRSAIEISDRESGTCPHNNGQSIPTGHQAYTSESGPLSD